MQEVKIGYIFDRNKPDVEEKIFLRLAKKKNIDLIMFNVEDFFNEDKIEEQIKKCDIVFNNTAGYFALELVKTIEALGKKVIESSEVYYYTEDKWMFFLKCKEHNIPTPDTKLLSDNLNSARKELEEFNHWPIILKRVEGCQGDFVEKAENANEAISLIKKFWKKGNERLPILAQEFIKSPSYRVTTVGNKIIQTALKESHGWKSTAVYAEKLDKFDVDKSLERLVKKILKSCKLNICGIDFLKKENKWIVLEVNSAPSFQFFIEEQEKIIDQVLDFLKTKAIS